MLIEGNLIPYYLYIKKIVFWEDRYHATAVSIEEIYSIYELRKLLDKLNR